jgi:hypothetical protein
VRDPCFFEFAQPDKRIAACTALIRSGVADITAVLLSRAGAFGVLRPGFETPG